MTNITSHASITVNAPATKVWKSITDSELVSEWFFGASVESDWKEGSPIIFRGQWEGSAYEDRGTIRAIEPGKLLEYTHLSSRTGQDDRPENYELIRFELTENGSQTTLNIYEDNLASEEARDKSVSIWNIVLANLKRVTESLG